VARQPALWWLTLFELTHREGALGPVPWAWPDGRPALRQPYLVHQVFGVIRAEARMAQRQAREARDG
jgi:hypothetical protein